MLDLIGLGIIAGVIPVYLGIAVAMLIRRVLSRAWESGLIGIATAIAVERILSGTGRFNVGLAVVGTIQGIGASSSNIVAGWLTDLGGYRLAYWFHGGIALIAVIVFLLWRHDIAPPQPGDGKPVSEPNPAPALP